MKQFNESYRALLVSLKAEKKSANAVVAATASKLYSVVAWISEAVTTRKELRMKIAAAHGRLSQYRHPRVKEVLSHLNRLYGML